MVYTPNTGIGFSDNFRIYPDEGLEGAIVDSFPHNILTLKNSGKATTQKNRITIGTASTNTYTLIFQSTRLNLPITTLTVTPTGTPTAADVQNLIVDAIRGNLNLSSRFKITKFSTTGIDIESRVRGAQGVFSLSVSGGGAGFVSTSSVVGNDAPVIPFGRILWTRNNAVEGDECSVIDGPLASGLVRGVSVLTEIFEETPGQSFGYPSQFPVNCARSAQIRMFALTDMQPTSPIHVYITGDNQGRVRASADGTDTVDISLLNIHSFGSVKANTIGVFEVNL